ncbi:MAG TPA: succinate dehydrogenase assembly factor 2 [Steroidobacteraceae bacterium]|nr:succinate dehydrogenase assembly factor 2 [Steroidobacteraceae bacterium]
MADPELSRLKWRCRRGMKELDLLLLRWLERGWPRADAERRRAFEWLLEQPDPDLADWLLGGLRPSGHARAALVDDILRLPA